MPKYDCILCNGKDCISYTPATGPRPALMKCHGVDEQEWASNWDWLQACAVAAGAPGVGALLSDPDKYLDRASGPTGRSSASGPLPDKTQFRDWGYRLWSRERGAREARYWLKRERGISYDVIEEHGIGWNGADIIIPLFDQNGRITTAKTKRPRDGVKPIAWPGRGREHFPLYPWPEPGGDVLICEGELDALRCLSVGIQATSVTLGVDTWRAPWHENQAWFADSHVYICFDVGAEAMGERLQRRFKQEGKQTWVVRLPGPKGYDLTDYLREHSARELRTLIGRARDDSAS